MSAVTPALSRSWPIGAYTVTLTLPRPKPGGTVFASVEWSPAEPKSLTGHELAEYRHHRNGAIAELAAELGVNVAVLEI